MDSNININNVSFDIRDIVIINGLTLSSVNTYMAVSLMRNVSVRLFGFR